MASQKRIARALLSVSDKSGLVDFARRLAALDIELLSTGGTAKALREAGLEVIDISDFTGSPEILDGRVKTLHPKVHGGILSIRDKPAHQATCREHGIEAIDLVVVNLYPFRETIAKPGVAYEEAVEQIDIGGPGMVRSAAKNHTFVTIVCSPSHYSRVIEELEANDGATTLELRKRLALEAFRHTASYDAAISSYFEKQIEGDATADLPETLSGAIEFSAERAFSLRYGENHHQRAAFYGDFARHFEQLWGIELSYNNLLDMSAAVELIEEFAPPTIATAIIKHTNPCGVAVGDTPIEAWNRALSSDEKSAHGGIVALNHPIDRELAETIHGFFTEIIAAPEFAPDALAILTRKKNRRLVRLTRPMRDGPRLRLRSAVGGLLVQEADASDMNRRDYEVVTKRAPSDEEWDALVFAWKIAKHLKSNAIAFTSSDRSLGLGAGQMSRVDAAQIAVMKARQAGIDLRASAVASDAFFPFPDGLVTCAEAGATAVIQPGGAKADDSVIRAADERDLAMVFTRQRHFRH